MAESFVQEILIDPRVVVNERVKSLSKRVSDVSAVK